MRTGSDEPSTRQERKTRIQTVHRSASAALRAADKRNGNCDKTPGMQHIYPWKVLEWTADRRPVRGGMFGRSEVRVAS